MQSVLAKGVQFHCITALKPAGRPGHIFSACLQAQVISLWLTLQTNRRMKQAGVQ